MHGGLKVPREGEQQSPAELLLLAAAYCSPHLDVENVGDHAKRCVNIQEDRPLKDTRTSYDNDFSPVRLPQAQNL